MSNTATPSPSSARHSAVRRHNQSSIAQSDSRRRLLLLAITPGAATIVVAGATIAYLLATSATLTNGTIAVVLSLAGLICVGVLITSAALVAGIGRTRQEQLDGLRAAVANDTAGLPDLIQQRQQGDTVHPYGSAVNAPSNIGSFVFSSGEFSALANDLVAMRRTALEAVGPVPPTAVQPEPVDRETAAPTAEPAKPAAVEAPASPPAPRVVDKPVLLGESFGDQRVSVFVNLARRLQSLVHREIKLLDELESQVEDPDLLKGLFAVDHLATRIRRHAENLAVLGGAVSRRQWSRPVNLYEVLRSAVAEIEHYSRVKLVRPIDGTVQGHAVADVIHLVAELVENATTFSAPATQVLVRVQHVTAGLAIDVEDRGLGMPAEERNRINAMLASPDDVDIDELLQDGRIGLFVVASLARRHHVALQMQPNIYGGTQAVVVLPHSILGSPSNTLPGKGHTGTQPKVAAKPPAEPVTAAAQSQPHAPQPKSDTPPPRPVADDDTVSLPRQSRPDTQQQQLAAAPVSAAPAPLDQRSAVPALSAEEIPPGSFDGFAPHPPYQDSEPLQGYPSHQSGPQGESTSSGWAMPQRQPGVTRPHSVTEPASPTSPDADEKPRVDEYWSSGSPTDDPPTTGRRRNRPALPQRRQQSHLAPQLRETPRADNRDTETAGHDPGLMSAFQRGAARSEKDS